MNVFVVSRISNGMLVGKSHVFMEDRLEDVKNCVLDMFRCYSESGVIPRDLPKYIDEFLESGFHFVYPFDGNVYRNEQLVVERCTIGETFRTEVSDEQTE